MIIGIIIFVVSTVSLLTVLNSLVITAYTQYKDSSDSYKKQCFDEFGDFEYEVIKNELYCKTSEGFVKSNSLKAGE